MKKNLWGARFTGGMDSLVAEFNASIGYDQRMYACDIKGSTGHVTMLAKQGIISEADKDAIVAGLQKIKARIAAGEVTFSVAQEDIHMAVEEMLIAELGDTGKKVHAGRSRNDQCAVDTRLYIKEQIEEIMADLLALQKVFLKKAEQYIDSLIPGFTHIQHAQPMTLGFYMMAYFQMFKRDLERLKDAYHRMDYCPLGACALAGTTLPIDRHYAAQLLGFAGPTENALDTVSERDYSMEFLSVAAISMVHISRIAEEFVWWNSQEFSYISIDDSYCTGSSMMPQKKNPDVAELLRGKPGRVFGSLMQLLTIVKGTPLSYNKDFQEDKEALFDAIDTWKISLRVLAGMLEKTEFKLEHIASYLTKGFLAATDVAERLVGQGVPFRQAHDLVGRMVRYCEEHDLELDGLQPADMAAIDPCLTQYSFGDLSPKACVEARTSFGGTAPTEVQRQIGVGKAWLQQQEANLPNSK